MSDADAQDIVQEVMLSVFKSLPEYQRQAGSSFKGWLLHITRWRIADQFRKRAPAALRVSGAQVYLVRHRLSGLVKKAVTAVEKQR